MAEQSGTGRYPKVASEAWASSQVEGANDPDQGNFGSPFAEAAGKSSLPKVDGDEGQGIHVPKGGSGRTFSSEEDTNALFEQGELPPTGINYFSFKG